MLSCHAGIEQAFENSVKENSRKRKHDEHLTQPTFVHLALKKPRLQSNLSQEELDRAIVKHITSGVLP